MGSQSSAGAALAISAATPATFDAAGYGALTFTEIGQIEKIGSVGASYAKVEFQPLKGPKQKFKGSVDNGTLSPSLAHDPEDAGQTLLRTAADDISTLYSFEITFQSGDKRYFQGRVFGYPETIDSADSIVMAAPTIEISTAIVKVAAA